MTAFGRGACVAVVDPAIQDNASADAGADASVKNVLVAAACTPEGLGEGGCVAIVIDANGYVIDFGDFLGEGKIAPTG